ncbi:MAG: hypothetical protein ACRC41_12810 [Sarcina sp.]
MNKLEVLYGVVKEIRDKSEFAAVVKGNVTRNGETIVSIENDVYKNCEKKEATAQISGFFIENGNKVEVKESLDVAALKAKKKAYMKEKLEGKEISKRKCKLTKAMFGLKLLNEIELVEEGEFNVLKLDGAFIKQMMEEKMKNKKCNCDPEKKVQVLKELGVPESLIALHATAMKAIHEVCDSKQARIYVDKNNRINKVLVEGKSNSTNDTFRLEVVSK